MGYGKLPRDKHRSKRRSRNLGQQPWSFRRRIIVSTLVFCGLTVAYTIVLGTPIASIGEAAVTGSFGLAGAIIGSYIFGAVWDDKRNSEDNNDYFENTVELQDLTDDSDLGK